MLTVIQVANTPVFLLCVFQLFAEDEDYIRERVKLYCGLFVAIGVAACLSMIGAVS